MTNTTTNMLNRNILNVLINMNSSNTNANISIVKQFGLCHMYQTVVDAAAVDADKFTATKVAAMSLIKMLVKIGRRRLCLRRRYAAPPDLFGSRPVVEAAGSRAKRFPKNLNRPLPYRITRAVGSGDLLSQTPVHADAQDEVNYGGGARHEIGKT